MERALLLLATAAFAALCTNLRLAATALLGLGAALCATLHLAASCGRTAAFDFSIARGSCSSCAAANGGGATDVPAWAFGLFTNRRFTADRRAFPNGRTLPNGRALPDGRALPNSRALPYTMAVYTETRFIRARIFPCKANIRVERTLNV
jgi:hypothetical protein